MDTNTLLNSRRQNGAYYRHQKCLSQKESDSKVGGSCSLLKFLRQKSDKIIDHLYDACVLYFCICTCSAQLSVFHMERHSRNTLITIIIITILLTWILS